MSYLKLIVIVLLAGNLLLLGLEASKTRPNDPPAKVAVVSDRIKVPTITLLSELEAAGAAQSGRQCFTVGPFETRPTVDAIVEMLAEYATVVSPRETEAFVDRGYWVYLPPFADEPGARQAVDALYDAGLDDVVVIKNGDWDNSVSLGYFINQANAIAHRDQVRVLGFEAEFRIQRDDESRFWVDYEQATGVEYASRILAGLVPSELHRPTACANNVVVEASGIVES